MTVSHEGSSSMVASALVPTYATYPFELARGEGMWVWDPAGRAYLDFYGGHAVASLGHSPAALARALAAQAGELLFYSNVAPIAVRERAAQALVEYAGGGFSQVFFCNSGTEANEAALKVAIQRSGRKRIAALQGGFHGRTLLSLSATHGPSYRKAVEGLLAPCLHLAPNSPEELQRLDESIAAIIVEPIQSIGGVVQLGREYLGALRARTRELGIALIFDEIQTGAGRLGASFAAIRFGVTPDMITAAKGLGGGMPVGAVLFTPEVAADIREGDLGSTFGGGPLACAAVLATLGEIARQGLHERVERTSTLAADRLAVGPVEKIRGEGWLMGLETGPPAKEVYRYLLDRGILTGTSADPHVLRLLPPLIAGEEHVEQLRRALLEWPEGKRA